MDADAIEKTLLVGLIGHDSAEGNLRLPVQSAQAGDGSAQEGTLQIVWPQARHGTFDHGILDRFAIGAQLVERRDNHQAI